MKYIIFIVPLFILGCKSDQTPKTESCACDDLQLDVLYNHFYLEDRTMPYTGVCVKKDKQGRTIETIHYLEGKVDGTLTKFFENGNIESESNFTRNMQHGDMKQWDSTGRLLIHCQFYKGELDTILIDNR